MFPVSFWVFGILFDLSVQMSASELHKGRKLRIRIQMSLHDSSYFHSQGSGYFIYRKDFILCLQMICILSLWVMKLPVLEKNMQRQGLRICFWGLWQKLTLTSFNQQEAEPMNCGWLQMPTKGAKKSMSHNPKKAKQLCTLKYRHWGVKPPSGMLASGFSGDGRGLLDWYQSFQLNQQII